MGELFSLNSMLWIKHGVNVLTQNLEQLNCRDNIKRCVYLMSAVR